MPLIFMMNGMYHICTTYAMSACQSVSVCQRFERYKSPGFLCKVRNRTTRARDIDEQPLKQRCKVEVLHRGSNLYFYSLIIIEHPVNVMLRHDPELAQFPRLPPAESRQDRPQADDACTYYYSNHNIGSAATSCTWSATLLLIRRCHIPNTTFLVLLLTYVILLQSPAGRRPPSTPYTFLSTLTTWWSPYDHR